MVTSNIYNFCKRYIYLISITNSKAVLEDRLLESNSSVLVIHDWERHYYKSMVTRSPVQ